MLIVDITTGEIYGGPGSFTAGCPFEWNNTTGQNVQLTTSSNYCTATTYDIGAGLTKAAQAANPLPAEPFNYTLKPDVWVGGPSNPHIQTPSMHIERKEVA
ncbi:MAG TPA: hypothetical protein VGM18_01490 [Candidatus Sulfotelmatobacter sp.]|jgi:hypothetical protein